MDPNQITKCHDLFNELHKELTALIDPNAADRDITTEEAQVAMTAFRLDALHHDFANITLAGATD